jgi:hypothetical protein
MNKITFPLTSESKGANLTDLQDALLLFLDKGIFQLSDQDQQNYTNILYEERTTNKYSDGTRKLVGMFQETSQLPVSGEVDEPTAETINRLLQQLGAFEGLQSDDYIVTGRVEFEDGTPAVGLRVGVFDRDLGFIRVLLGDPQYPVITGEDGVFPAVHYHTRDFTVGEGHIGPTANLVFTVTTVHDETQKIVSIFRRLTIAGETIERPITDLVLGYSAGQTEEVRIVLAGRPSEDGLSEYQRLMRDLEPLLINNATPADFDQEHYRDIDFSARETGWDRALIETMMLAWQLARAASGEPQLLAETFYGTLRHGPPTEVAPLAATLHELLDQDTRWASKLEDSLNHFIIGGELPQHIEYLRNLRTEALSQVGDGRRASIGDILAFADIAEQDRRSLLSAYQAFSGTTEEFWRDDVAQRLGWSNQKIVQAQTTLHMAEILAYDLPLMTKLKDMGFVTARDLVKLDRSELVDLVTKLGPPPDAPGDTIDEQISRMVAGIASVVDATYPTETMARMAITSSDTKLVAARDLLTRFFETEAAVEGGEGFDISTSPVTSYLETHGDRVFEGLEPDQRARLTSQLQRLQRVFRLGVNRAQTEILLALDLDSAFRVTRFSPEHFISEFGDRLGGADQASLVYGRAEAIAGTILYMYTDLWQGVHGVQPMSIKSASQPEKIPALKELPAYRTLFGNLNLCECEQCRSFYSPAAYFVDLLHMLDRPALAPNNPAEVLFQRRPDLAYIQLTCENTNMLIPYVDLVTEILESFVANSAPQPFNVPPAPPNHNLPSPTAAELRVNPVYLTAASSMFADKAYEKLQDAAFPLTLPLNLPLETTRVYLSNLGTSRADLMQLLDRDPGFEALMARAAEILLLSPEEFELISGAKFGGARSSRPATTAEFFGLSLAATPTTLFNHAAPDFVRNPAAPDQRSTLIRSLQNILSIISPPPIPDTESGRFDVATEAAVNAYLLKKGLPQNGETDTAFWGALEADGMPSLSVLMCPVPLFLDRSGLTYEELIALVRTRFVNPTMQGEGDVDYLARLGIPTVDVREWIQAGFPALPLSIMNQLTIVGEDPIVFAEWVKRRARAVVINLGFEVPCDLDRATLMHLDGTLLSPQELVTLFRLVRLLRKLGWKMEELDAVLEPGSLDASVVFNTVLLLANVKQLRDQMKASIPDIVSLWQTIPTYGNLSLYDRLFRNRAAQLIDPILELNRERTELKAAESITPPALSDHTGSILAAFHLSAQELEGIREATGLNDDPMLPPISQPHLNIVLLSAIYRRVVLARALQVSVRELLSLINLSGLTVFERPDLLPRGSALLFIELVDKVRASGVKVSQLEYLCRDVPQPPGLPGTQRDAWHRTLASILSGLNAIAAEEPIEDDPVGEELTARLTAILGVEDARATTALIYGTDIYKTTLTGFPTSFVFPASVSGKIIYDASRNELRYRGAMTTLERMDLLAAPGVPAALQAAYVQAVKSLDAQPRVFVARALKSMFSPTDAEAMLIDVSSLGADGGALPKVIDQKINEVLARRRNLLSRSLIKQALTTATGLTADIVGLFLENEKVLTALSGPGPAMADFQAIDGDGLDAAYFSGAALMGPPTMERVDALDWQGAVPSPSVPVVSFSARWKGYLFVPSAGEVTFHLRCSDGVRVSVNDMLVIDEWHDQLETEYTVALRLDGGQFYPIVVEYYNQTGNPHLSLSWASPSISAEVISQTSLYSAGRIEGLLQRVERIYKLALFLAPFSITARDLKGLAERGDIVLDSIPVSGEATLPVAQAMFSQWLSLNDFAVLRDRYSSSELSLIDVMNAPADMALARFATLTGAPFNTINAIIDVFTIPDFDAINSVWMTDAPNLTKLEWWRRIADVLSLAQRIGASPAQLLTWAKTRQIKELPTGPETQWFTWTALEEDGITNRRSDNALLAQEAKNLVRARYDEDGWRAAAASLNDVIRIRRRSALTGYVLAMPEMMHSRVSDTDRLFEFLLIDVEMDPCMETSRIKQGISSIQLFTQRILLNLESPQVPPAFVDRHRWEWMKNYRVWEANRKVFLYAETYTEEELRDDKTPIFKELESELLQDELTEPNVERVFRHYLEKLDDIAKLIVCGTCIDSNGATLHIFGRTATTPFVFYHRRLDAASGLSWTEGVWSPWEKLPVDVAVIEDGKDSGAHLMPIVWNRRLYLFWLVFEQKPDEALNAQLPDGFDSINCWHIKLAWSEYKDRQWSLKQVGLPVIVSKALTKQSPESNNWVFYKGPDHQVVTTYTTDSSIDFNPFEHPLSGGWGINSDTQVSVTTEPKPHLITPEEDDLLGGTLISKDGDYAVRIHSGSTLTVLSLMPKPADHYIDANVSGSSLTIHVFSRFEGLLKGHSRTVNEDAIWVIRDGQRTDRKERSQSDASVTGEATSMFQQVGSFNFPACSADLDATTDGLALNFNSLERPETTKNSFMALRRERLGFGKSLGLRLRTGAPLILKWVPTPFEVIDSDNRSGFNRSGPFFYQDQQRCYLVTRDARARIFNSLDALRVTPDPHATLLESAIGLNAIDDHSIGLAPDAGLRTNPWTHAALLNWAASPGLPVSLRSEPTIESHTLSGSFAVKKGFNSDAIKAVLDSVVTKALPEYTFTPHRHPYTCQFIAALNSGGFPALFTLKNESLTDERMIFGGVIGGPMPIFFTNYFESIYKPDPDQVVQPYPLEEVDFSRSGAYSNYHWETFFHVPMTVAISLNRAGKYEDALRWFHFVFDPMTGESDTSDKRAWRFLPFRTADTMRIEETLHLLTYTGSDSAKLKQKANLQASIQEWLTNPFNPHIIARRRPVVYMKYVFMKYLDNLISWADELFQRDTMESINEATQLYILAANLLGPKPQRAPAPGLVEPMSYQELRGKLDELSNAQVDLETRMPFAQMFGTGTGIIGQLTHLPQTLYFCLPQNDKMLTYWDTIADRLFKIRHCMNMDGTVRQLPLFEPPIDPMLLVEAVAHGLDIGSVLNDLYAPLPRYRFSFMLQQALAMCNEVRSLGSTLLSVLEKRDAEKLSALRAEQETQLLEQVRANKKLLIDEAEQSQQALENTARMVSARIDYYENLLAQGLISEETDQLGNLDRSNDQQETASWIEATAQALNLIPNISTGENNDTTFGGSNLGAATSAVGRSYSYLAASYSYKANRASITGGHARRAEEWRFQRDQAKRESNQVDRQIAAARIRKEITQADLRNHETQIEHAQSIEDLLRTKFTNDALYSYLEGNLRAVYFQCYQAAYEIAKRAERCWQYERGADASFVKYGAWDSSVRGLLAGERLYFQLKQMERAYQEQQVREFEITKHVSILQLDPLSLIELKETGMCEVDIPELLFDLDYAGHYFRRLKTVSITIPAVVGPYTSLSATLTLLNSKVRESSRVIGNYGDDENYRSDHLAVEAVAASIGQNDSGRFQLELRDEKYLPFEGAGAISRWRIELPHKFRSFDYDTISDIVIHLKYTSRRDETLAGPALDSLKAELEAAGGRKGILFRFFSLRHEFPTEWQLLRMDSTHAATFTIAKERFSLLAQGGSITVKDIHSALILRGPNPSIAYKATLTPGALDPITLEWPGNSEIYRSFSQVPSVPIPISTTPADNGWKLQITQPALPADLDKIQDILIVVNYSVAM